MNRSPLYYPMSRGGDAEAGGAADLQTDVMRFMAILSLCLMAIFAIVQSIPLAPTPPVPTQPKAESEPESKQPQPQQELVSESPASIVQEDEIILTRPAPARLVPRRESIALQRPKPAPVRSAEAKEVAVAPEEPVKEETPVAEAAPVEEGFSLRFETDAALTRLVARQLVGFYAITPEKSLRMNITGDDISFWPASLPGRYHEMDESTVPGNVLAAYLNSNQSRDVKWGVTLPISMSQELNGYLSSETGGSLIIAANGQIDLRH